MLTPANSALSRWVIDSATDFAMIATDLDGRVTAWSAGAEHILGWTEAEMLGQTVDQIFTSEDRAAGRVAAEMRCALASGVGNDERWHARKSGERFWANGQMTLLKNDADETVGFVKVLRDRTDQHRAVEALREHEAQTRLLLDSTAEAIYAVDREGRTTLCNAAFVRMMGFTSAEEALGLRLHDVIHHTHKDGSPFPAQDCPLYRAAREGVAAHLADDLFFKLDGTPLPVEYWATPILRDGQCQGAICTFLDITDRKQADDTRKAAEDALRALNDTLEERVEERTRELRDSMDFARLALSAVGGVGVWTYDVETDRFFCDASVAKLYDIDPHQGAAGIKPAAFLANVHEDDRAELRAKMESGLLNRGDLELEYRLVHADGSVHWVLSRGHTYFDEHAKPVRRTGVGVEVTKQRSVEEQLRQSQKLETIGQLTGGVAHDFNNLLTIISSSADFLQRPDLTEERRRRYLGAIRETVTRASTLTSQLLAFARRQPLKPEVFDVCARVRRTADLVRSLVGSRIDITVAETDHACLAYADAAQFETALVNLLVNARDAMKGEGKIAVELSGRDALPAVRAHSRRPGAFVAISVTDTGSGIAADKLAAIFEPFFTTKAVGKGTGLGLSQVFGFAKQSKGEVEVESAPGQGATFTIYLPRSEDLAAVKAPAPAQGFQPQGEGAHVLVVEDNEAVGQFSTEMLHDLGYKTTWAADASEALAYLLDPQMRFGLVFTDVIMPGMNGIDFAKEVRARFSDLPVLLTSGYSDVLAEEGSHGFDLIQKPYSAETLAHSVSAALVAVKTEVG